MTKELLSSWGVEFDLVDVEGDPAAQRELERLGVPVAPAIAVGERAVHGWDPPAYAALLGIAYAAPARLSPPALAARLDGIIGATERLVGALRLEHLDHRPPQRDRSVRDLAFHVFRLSLAFVDGMDMGRVPEAWLRETAPAELVDGPAVARYGALVRGRVGGWLEGAGAGEYARVIDAPCGPLTGHELLERTTWHAAQHLRQLHALAEGLGAPPEPPLSGSLFEGLPLPGSLW